MGAGAWLTASPCWISKDAERFSAGTTTRICASSPVVSSINGMFICDGAGRWDGDIPPWVFSTKTWWVSSAQNCRCLLLAKVLDKCSKYVWCWYWEWLRIDDNQIQPKLIGRYEPHGWFLSQLVGYPRIGDFPTKMFILWGGVPATKVLSGRRMIHKHSTTTIRFRLNVGGW